MRARVAEDALAPHVEEQEGVGRGDEDRVGVGHALALGAQPREPHGHPGAQREELHRGLVLVAELAAADLVADVEVADRRAAVAHGDAQERARRRVAVGQAAEGGVVAEARGADGAPRLADELEQADRAGRSADARRVLGRRARERARHELRVLTRVDAHARVARAGHAQRLLRDGVQHGVERHVRRGERLREREIRGDERVDLRLEAPHRGADLAAREREPEHRREPDERRPLARVERLRRGQRVRDHALEAPEREERQGRDRARPAEHLVARLGHRRIEIVDRPDELRPALAGRAGGEQRGIERHGSPPLDAGRREAAVREQPELAPRLGGRVDVRDGRPEVRDRRVEHPVDHALEARLLGRHAHELGEEVRAAPLAVRHARDLAHGRDRPLRDVQRVLGVADHRLDAAGRGLGGRFEVLGLAECSHAGALSAGAWGRWASGGSGVGPPPRGALTRAAKGPMCARMRLEDHENQRLRALYRLDDVEVEPTASGGMIVRVRRGEHVEEREVAFEELSEVESVYGFECEVVRELAERLGDRGRAAA